MPKYDLCSFRTNHAPPSFRDEVISHMLRCTEGVVCYTLQLVLSTMLMHGGRCVQYCAKHSGVGFLTERSPACSDQYSCSVVYSCRDG